MPALFSGLRLLAVVPHPDDESYAFAGLLALSADAGATVHLLCATRGEGGENHLHHPTLPLAAIRTAELEASCATLGLRPPRFLDLPDGGLNTTDPGHLQQLLADHLTDTDPNLVISLGPDGAYGHTDHLALTTALTTAVDALPDPPRLLHALFPPELFLPQWRRMTQGPNARTVDTAAPSLGAPPDHADLALDIRSVRQRKLDAIAAHRSQLPDGTPQSLFPPGLVDALLDVERFTIAAGPPLDPASSVSDPVDALRHLFAGLHH
jgi:N-acetyl-1-D-myo-inositol-2-amino-2-deoxy-alpha-D-glucopyranoside deacetylase